MEVEYTYWIFILALHGNHLLIPFGRWIKWFTVWNSASCFFFFRRQSWFDISPTFVISFNIQHPKKNSSVHLQQNPWGLNDSSIDFPYDDHSYMIFPYYDGDMNHWDFSGLWGRARKGQTVDQGHPGAIDENQVMIICVLDMNLVGHFLKTYIFFQPNKVVQ